MTTSPPVPVFNWITQQMLASDPKIVAAQKDAIAPHDLPKEAIWVKEDAHALVDEINTLIYDQAIVIANRKKQADGGREVRPADEQAAQQHEANRPHDKPIHSTTLLLPVYALKHLQQDKWRYVSATYDKSAAWTEDDTKIVRVAFFSDERYDMIMPLMGLAEKQSRHRNRQKERYLRAKNEIQKARIEAALAQRKAKPIPAPNEAQRAFVGRQTISGEITDKWLPKNCPYFPNASKRSRVSVEIPGVGMAVGSLPERLNHLAPGDTLYIAATFAIENGILTYKYPLVL